VLPVCYPRGISIFKVGLITVALDSVCRIGGNMDDSQIEAWKRALRNARRRPPPEIADFLDTLDAMEFHIAVYLIVDLKVPYDLIPKLIPLIDQRCFERRLTSEIDELLKKLEEQ
jgi:hypothetical protein